MLEGEQRRTADAVKGLEIQTEDLKISVKHVKKTWQAAEGNGDVFSGIVPHVIY